MYLSTVSLKLPICVRSFVGIASGIFGFVVGRRSLKRCIGRRVIWPSSSKRPHPPSAFSFPMVMPDHVTDEHTDVVSLFTQNKHSQSRQSRHGRVWYTIAWVLNNSPEAPRIFGAGAESMWFGEYYLDSLGPGVPLAWLTIGGNIENFEFRCQDLTMLTLE